MDSAAKTLLAEIEAFLAKTGATPTKLGLAAVNDGHLVANLRKGHTVTLKTAGSQTVTATDTASSSVKGEASVSVSAAAASTVEVNAPSSATAGSAFNVTVTARDQYGNTATGYRGTVHFTTTDRGAGVTLPADYTFTAADSGMHTFGSSAPLKDVQSKFGFTQDKVAETAKEVLGR